MGSAGNEATRVLRRRGNTTGEEPKYAAKGGGTGRQLGNRSTTWCSRIACVVAWRQVAAGVRGVARLARKAARAWATTRGGQVVGKRGMWWKYNINVQGKMSHKPIGYGTNATLEGGKVRTCGKVTTKRQPKCATMQNNNKPGIHGVCVVCVCGARNALNAATTNHQTKK